MTDQHPDQTAGRTSGAYSADSADPLEQHLRAALAPRLEVVRAIGAGGMARVFLAREPSLQRLVAIKVLSSDLAAIPEARARFEREAQAVAGLTHPNIVAIHGVGELDDGTPYFVMQHVSGRSMHARVHDEGPLSVAEARRILADVAAALAYAHAQGIIHRDVKPANILYEEVSGRALVSDFGIAALTRPTEQHSVRLTGTGIVLGTPLYMSPEQLLAEPVTDKTDVYALGLLAHELLAGRVPFDGNSPTELVAAHLRDVPARLRAIRPDVDAELDEVVARCLEKDASKRPSADEVARRLAPAASSLLEWPPPGLEELRGSLRELTAMYWAGDALIVAGVAPAMALGLRTPFVYVAPVLPGIVAAIGWAFGVVAMIRTGHIGALMARGTADGYGWLTMLEVLADSRGDTGQLIAGAREYAAVEPRHRTTLRARRVLASLLVFLAGVVLLPLLVVFVIMGSAGRAGPGAAWIAFAIPAVAALTAFALAGWEQRAFAAERRQRRSVPQSKHGPGLARSWYGTLDAIRGAKSLHSGDGRPLTFRAAAVLVAVLAVAAGVLLLPIAALETATIIRWNAVALPDPAFINSKIQLAEVARPLALSADPRITPQQAGLAYWRLGRGSGAAPHSAFDELPSPAVEYPPTPWLGHLPANAFPTARPKSVTDVPDNLKILQAASRGFTPAEMAFLERIAHAGLWRDVDVVARAPRMDYMGARFRLPFTDTLSVFALPLPRMMIKTIAYAGASRAAWYLARAQRDSAELTLRQVISLGFAVIDNATTLSDTYIGSAIVRIGRQELADYYMAIGDPRGARLTAQLDSVRGAIEARSDAAVSAARSGLVLQDPYTVRDFAVRVAEDPTESRGVRLDMLHFVGIAPCTNVRELVFGPDDDVRRAFATARRRMARSAADSALIDLISETPERLRFAHVQGFGPKTVMTVARVSGALLHNRRLPGCAALLLGTF